MHQPLGILSYPPNLAGPHKPLPQLEEQQNLNLLLEPAWKASGRMAVWSKKCSKGRKHMSGSPGSHSHLF